MKELLEREHIVELNYKEKEELARWLTRPNGGCYFPRVAFELVEGGGILVRTRPYNPPFSNQNKNPMKTYAPICKNCKHCQRNKIITRTMDICARPLRSKLCLVTGETVQTFTDLFCESERRAISKLERLFGCDACGKEGRHFLAINQNKNP